MKKKSCGGFILGVILVFVALGVLIQFIPYGKNLTNAPVQKAIQWDSPQTEGFARRACYDCHSNEAKFPWYSKVAPASWLLQFDVDRARRELNFSDWDNMRRPAGAIIRKINEGEMPPIQYLALHPEARLTVAEKQQFINGIQQSSK